MLALSIFILCHNRPDDAKHAIRSVLAQADSAFTLTVSDNSSTDDVEQMVHANFPSVNYIRRHPMLPALMHFNQCIAEAKAQSSTDYFCLFHDDDLMHPDFVQEIKRAAMAHPQAVALGSNAIIEELGTLQTSPSFRSHLQFEKLSSARQLAARYFSRYQCGIAPFPGYVYRTQACAELQLPPEGGKYADVTWLLNLAAQGPVVWIRKPLMTYRLHGGNDGSVESRRDRLRFLGFLKQNVTWLGNAVLQDYRCSFIYKPVVKQADTTHPHRAHLAKAYLRGYHWVRYARFETYQALARRAFVKWMAKE